MKQFDQMQSMMKKFRKMGVGGLMGMAKNLMGGNAFDSLIAGAADQDPEGLAKLQQSMGNPTTQNPFGLLPPMGGGATPGGLPKSFFTKNRNKKR